MDWNHLITALKTSRGFTYLVATVEVSKTRQLAEDLIALRLMKIIKTKII